MIFGDLNINIKDYLGRIGPGITVALSILYKDNIYESMCWYTDDYYIIELPEELEVIMGKIEEHKEYDNIINHLKSNTINYIDNVQKMDDILDD